jgi:hypothetical protein
VDPPERVRVEQLADSRAVETGVEGGLGLQDLGEALAVVAGARVRDGVAVAV